MLIVLNRLRRVVMFMQSSPSVVCSVQQWPAAELPALLVPAMLISRPAAGRAPRETASTGDSRRLLLSFRIGPFPAAHSAAWRARLQLYIPLEQLGPSCLCHALVAASS